MAKLKTRTNQPVDGDLLYYLEQNGSTTEIGGNLYVDGTLQVGDTTTDENELAKLPRTLLTPLTMPSEQKVVGVDTANAQNLLGLGEGLQIENEKIKVGGNIVADNIEEKMSGYQLYSSISEQITLTYVGVSKIGNKITFAVAGRINLPQDFNYSEFTQLGGLYITIPKNVYDNIIGSGASANPDVVQVKLINAFNAYNEKFGINVYIKKDTGYGECLYIRLYGTNNQTINYGVNYGFRFDTTFILGNNLVGE